MLSYLVVMLSASTCRLVQAFSEQGIGYNLYEDILLFLLLLIIEA